MITIKGIPIDTFVNRITDDMLTTGTPLNSILKNVDDGYLRAFDLDYTGFGDIIDYRTVDKSNLIEMLTDLYFNDNITQTNIIKLKLYYIGILSALSEIDLYSENISDVKKDTHIEKRYKVVFKKHNRSKNQMSPEIPTDDFLQYSETLKSLIKTKDQDIKSEFQFNYPNSSSIAMKEYLDNLYVDMEINPDKYKKINGLSKVFTEVSTDRKIGNIYNYYYLIESIINRYEGRYSENDEIGHRNMVEDDQISEYIKFFKNIEYKEVQGDMLVVTSSNIFEVLDVIQGLDLKEYDIYTVKD